MNGVVALNPTSMRQEAPRRDAGDDQRDPGPSPADDPSRERREEHRHGRHRQGVEPGLQRGKPAYVLEVEGVEEEEPAERGERGHGDDRGRGERHRPEEAQVDERLVGPVLPDQERSQRHGGHDEGPDDERRRPAPARGLR